MSTYINNYRIGSWNVNSLRVRLEQVLLLLKTQQLDILALQETKLQNKDFPRQIIEDMGYHVVFNGQKTYNGVALISRLPLTDVLTTIDDYDDSQVRLIAATVSDIRIVNLYVPNGQSVNSDKYQYKLDWLAHVTRVLKKAVSRFAKLLIVGDFNIAPDDDDVYDPVAFGDQILVSRKERQAFNYLCGCGLQDTFRLFTNQACHFSWWDYRLNCFKRGRGLRIDLILASQLLANHCTASFIDIEPRKHQRPSDHAPAIATFSIR